MKKILFSLFLLCSWVVCQGAPELTNTPKKCDAFKPGVLYSSLLYEKDAKNLSKSSNFGQDPNFRKDKGREYWVVFSDRDNNTTFTAPNGSTPYKKLSFNERVRIAKIENGYALVYREDKNDETYPKFSANMEWKGWVPMSKLLLWDTCPANEKGIYNKAMLCANIDESLDNGNLGKLFKDPKNLKTFEKLSVNFNYYFIMKREGNMVLLAHQNTMNGDSYKVLYGWVDENSYVAWNQRSCLEPTWEIEDVEFFSKNGVKVNIYDDASMKPDTKASYITYTKKNSSDYDPFMYRMSGDELRYPILDRSTSKLWNCSTFSSTGKKGAINAEAEKTSGMEVLKSNLNELSKIKIAIVIDGTKSMEPYFPAVKEAVKEFNKYFSKSDKVQVGVLIFRDIKDGEYATEVYPMTNPENTKLAEFLDNGGKYGIKSSSSDRTLEEALYYGIDKALDSFGFNPMESNMMFVIGDCGNSTDYPSITKETIVKKLVDKNVSILGFQVRNDSKQAAYTLFNNNICDLIKASLQQKFSELDKAVVVKPQLKNGSYEFTNNASSLEGALYVGSHKFVQSGVMEVSELKEQLYSAVVKVQNTIQHQKDILAGAQRGVVESSASAKNSFSNNSDITGPKLDMLWLRQRIGDAYFDSFQKTNTTVSFKGYTLKTDSSSERDYYKTVIFISQQELNTLMQRLAPLYEVAMLKGNSREPYVKAMKALVQSLIPGISDSEMNQMGYDEVMGLVAGLNASTMALKGRSIIEVADPNVVKAAEYQTIIAKFKRQYLKLQTIQKRPYKFVQEFNGAKYYWIPTEDLP